MKRELLVTAAALALIASTNVASAQSGEQMRGPGAAQQQLNNKEQDQGIKSGQIGTGGGATEEINREKSGKTQTQKQDAQPKPGMAQKEQNDQPGVKEKRSTQNQNGQAKPSTAQKETAPSTAQKESAPSTAQKESGSQTGTKEQQSTQNQGSGKSVQLSQEQRTKIHATIVNQKAERVTNVNFSVKVGTRVPRTVHFYPLPVQIIEIVPEYRGYEYILVGDEIVIIDPRTLEIVAIIPA